jgi:hypothetical protein
MLYRRGVLAYLSHDVVRVLQLHDAAADERVIDLRRTVARSRWDAQALPPEARMTFTLLNCEAGYLVCLLELGEPVDSSYLLVVRLQPEDRSSSKALVLVPLDSTAEIFARNDSSYLHYGTRSEIGFHGHKEWAIQGVDLRTGKPIGGKVYLGGFVGCDIGLTVCFEILDGFFYALSNQTSYEVEEIDWTSFFHCYRFPVDRPQQQYLQMKNDIWRRNHEEGTLHDSWTHLKLERDESSGSLVIVETRREWPQDGLSSQRVHYMQPLDMPELPETPKLLEFDVDPEILPPHADEGNPTGVVPTAAGTLPFPIPPRPGSSDPAGPVDTLPTMHDLPRPRPATEYLSSAPETRTSPSSYAQVYNLPDEALTRTLTEGDKPNYCPPQARLPRHVHHADDTTPPTYILAKTKIRHYNPSSNSFLDLVDHPREPLPGSGVYSSKQSLHFRIGGRRRLPPQRNPHTGLLIPVPIDPATGVRRPEALEVYRSREEGVRMWPPVATSLDTPEDRLLHDILNPIPCNEGAGAVFGVADERSVVYMTGQAYGSTERAIVFVNFDEGIKLQGLKTRRDIASTHAAAEAGSPHGTAGLDQLSQRATGSHWREAGRDAFMCTQPAEYLRIQKGLWLSNRPYLDTPSTSMSPKRKRAEDKSAPGRGWHVPLKRNRSHEHSPAWS